MTNPALARALASLPEDLRQVLVLAAHQRLDNAAVAMRLGITVEEAERRLAQALLHLAAKMR